MAPRKASADGASTLLRTQTIGRAMASGALGIGGQTQEHTAATIGRSSRDGLAAAARAATIPEGTAIVPTGGAPTSEVHAEYAQTIGRTIAGFDAETGRGIATRINTREASGGTLGAAGAGTLLRSQSSYYGSFSSFGAFAATMPQPLPTPAPGTAFGAGAGALSGMTIGAAARTALPAASWRRSNGYIRLVVAAGVCNRAAPRRAAPTADGEATAVPVATGAPVPLDGDASDQALYRFVDGVVPISLVSQYTAIAAAVAAAMRPVSNHAVSSSPRRRPTHCYLAFLRFCLLPSGDCCCCCWEPLLRSHLRSITCCPFLLSAAHRSFFRLAAAAARRFPRHLQPALQLHRQVLLRNCGGSRPQQRRGSWRRGSRRGRSRRRCGGCWERYWPQPPG